MGLFKKKDITNEYFKLLQDIGNLEKGNATKVELFDDHLELSNMVQKTPISLKYSQITDVEYTNEIERIEKSKSVIGRAIAGKVLFGNIGAQVGAISGMGTKEKKKQHFLFAISYVSSSGEDSTLLFEDTRLYHGFKLYSNLIKKCGLEVKNKEVTEL